MPSLQLSACLVSGSFLWGDIMKKKQYELIEAYDSDHMSSLLCGDNEKIELDSYMIGSAMDIIKYLLKTDLKEYKLIKSNK